MALNDSFSESDLMGEPSLVAGFNCSEPAYHEFPDDIFSSNQRENGAIIVHIFVVIYIFVAIAVVCDDYFVSSLGKVCEKLGFSEDVAGATFMAAGSSAPELFTSIIGVFVAKGDVGTGTIVGSAVFNLLCIIGVCGYFCGHSIQLNWWPLARDCGYYLISILVLIVVIYDSRVTWFESLFMLILYAGYILIMKYNRRLGVWAMSKAQHIPSLPGGAGFVTQDGEKVRSEYLPLDDDRQQILDYGDEDTTVDFQDISKGTAVPGSMQERAETVLQALTLIRIQRRVTLSEVTMMIFMTRRFRAWTRIRAATKLIILERRRLIYEGRLTPHAGYHNTRSMVRQLTHEDPDLPTFDHWKVKPKLEEVGILPMIKWFLMAPIRYAYYYTIPDCRKTRWEKYYIATFGMSITWIALLSYVMVWMVTLIGFTVGIGDSVMGITFLAAGTSIPDCMASLIVAKQGRGDMAVSNSVGSNVFDILLGLATPWFIQTAFVSPGSSVHINSKGLVFSVFLLFMTVAALVGGIHKNRWRLDKRIGVFCLSIYVVFVIISSMIESNVFGYVNPPNCPE